MIPVAQVSVDTEVIAHHLRIFGVHASRLEAGIGGIGDVASTIRKVRLISGAGADSFGQLRGMATNGDVVLAVLPRPDFLDACEIAELPCVDSNQEFEVVHGGVLSAGRLRSFHSARIFSHASGVPIVRSMDGRATWLRVPLGSGQIVVVGSNLAADLTRYRQGDPGQADARPTEALWGIAGERPNYLFDAQIEAGHEHDRPADWWALALAQVAAEGLGEPLLPLLPGGAPGAIVITGDDDQAFLEKYDEQLALLDGLPITYFLHPLTRHSAKTLAAMERKHSIELGLHPDALAQPDQYAELYQEQAAWFRSLTGNSARLVRNHGFLNDGYWGHLPVWLRHGATASSNLPGLNGKVLNGSLLPARMAWNGQLTSHWSILTAIGDGVRFALGLDGPQSAQCMRDMADRITLSKLPGVIVLNLHPQNVAQTREMHLVLHELVRDGFVAMTLGQCVDWFAARDRGDASAYKRPPAGSLLGRVLGRVTKWRRANGSLGL